ncbi:hypothetical protein BGZ94_006677, partial [Podila epigama]
MIVKKTVIDYADDSHDLGDLLDGYDPDLEEWPSSYFLEALEGHTNDNSQSFRASFTKSSLQDIYDKGLEVELDKPTVDLLIDMFDRYYEHERQLIASIKD